MKTILFTRDVHRTGWTEYRCGYYIGSNTLCGRRKVTVQARTYRVWFIRYGVQHYYPTESLGEAQRFIRVYKAIGGIELQCLEHPDGTKVEV